MTSGSWRTVLEGCDAGYTGNPIDHRHPLLDLRVLEFGLSLPAIPWCVDKFILRECTRGRLPEMIRKRPKSPLAGNPNQLLARAHLASSREMPVLHPAMERYIDVQQLPKIIDELGTEGYWLVLRIFSLNFWLQNYSR